MRLAFPLQPRWSCRSARKVTWLELFFDLVFVAAVAQVASPLHHHYDAAGLLRFSTLFVLIWWAWVGHTVFSTRFDSDDVVQRALTLVQMFVVAAMAANATDALGSRSSAGFAAAYAAMRLVLVFQYVRARQVPGARGLASRYMAGHGIAAMLWLASALAPIPARFVMWTAALAIDLGTPWLAERHAAAVPHDADHLPERFGLFTLILLGESVVAVMHGMEHHEYWSARAALSAFFGMATTFVLWWWYFDGAASAVAQRPRTRREAMRFQLWSYAHLPLSIGIVVAAAGVRRAIAADQEALLAAPGAALLGAALSLAMAALAVIGATSGTGGNGGSLRSALRLHVPITALTLAVGVLGSRLLPASAIVLLWMLCAAQLALALASVRGRRTAGERWPRPSSEPAVD